MSSPFDAYPKGGRELLGPLRGSDNCRHGYGLDLQRRTGQSACAYCGISFTESYHQWLLMAVDHVVPSSVGRLKGIPAPFMGDVINQVLACSGCNSLGNRYVPAGQAQVAFWTIDEFLALRDAIYTERCALIEKRRAIERAFFDSRPWQTIT
jgi:hypothetical protein